MTTVTSRTRPARSGFTLIELLVVISIIAVLVGLGVGVFFTVRSGGQKSATEATLTKVQSELDGQWKAVLDQAAEDAKQNKIPPAVVTFAGNDPQRARAVWAYLLLKNEFPTTVAEAVSPVVLVLPPPVGAVTVLPPKSVYTRAFPAFFPLDAAKIATLSAIPDEFESAACLHVAITATGRRGQLSSGAAGLANQTGEVDLGGTAHSCFKDNYGMPVAFARMAFSVEINAPPFTRKTTLRDPVDPDGTLIRAVGVWDNTRLQQFWDVVVAGHLVAGHPADYPPAAIANTPAYTTSAGLVPNWVPTVVSFGPNKKAGKLLGGDADGDDNILSFRLRQQGARGD